MRQPGGAGGAAAILPQHGFRDPAAIGQPGLEQLENGRARCLPGTVAGMGRGQRRHVAAQHHAVDQLVEFQGDLCHMPVSALPFWRRL